MNPAQVANILPAKEAQLVLFALAERLWMRLRINARFATLVFIPIPVRANALLAIMLPGMLVSKKVKGTHAIIAVPVNTLIGQDMNVFLVA